jgi:metal-sulfur cluster biosynthetic enzyme/tetratricopeptide (TPR) repeat protein
MTTTTPEEPDEDSGGGSRVEMHAASHDFSTFTQIGIQNVQLPPEAFRPWAEIAAPPGLRNVPVRPGLFVGRARELARLDAALAGPGGVVVQAMHGLGGIGKSTLAAYWAAAHASDYTLTWWITAATPADIDAGLASLAVALQPALSGALPMETLREGAVQWLAAHRGWLLILDNVTDPADVAPLLARAPAGRYLITSRRASGWHRTAVPVRLDVLDPAEAQALLAAILTQDQPRELEGTAELSAELGFLPLAIEQAGAYIAETGITPTEYLDLLTRYLADMYAQTAEGGDDQRTIARIWHVTLDRLADDPLAGQVLRILAWYAPEAIPRALLDGLTDPPALLHAVGRLAAYSMLTADGGTLAVHLLVQAVTRTPDPGDPHRSPQAIDDARAQATALLADAAPPWEDPAGWPTWRALLPHVEALARNTSSTSSATDTPSTANLLSQAAAFMEDQGALARAIPLYERALAACLRLLGEDNVHTLDARSNVAYAYAKAGDLSRAIPLLEANLQDRARALGEDHPDTLASRSKLAFAYEVAGHLARAKPLYQSAYDDCLRVLGPDHSQTLTALKNVAYAYQTDGDLARAIPLFERALAACLRVLGEDNVHTLEARNNVASAYLTAGNLSRAIPLYESAYAGCLRVLGENHPGTLATRGNLADAYLKAGDLDRAIPVYENAYADCLRVLGPDHSHTLVACRDLAFAYAAADDLIKAIPMLEQTLDGYRRVLGEKHPDTLGTRVNLATFYSNAGYLDRAMQMYKKAYEHCLLALGPNHPHTLIARSSLDSMKPGFPSYLGPGGIGFWTSGKPAAPPVEFGPGTEDLVEALRDVIDPELGVDVVDLGLVYDVTVGPDRIATIDMTLTGADTYIDVIEDQTRAALEGLVSELRINWVWTPPWGPDKITEDGRDMLRALGFNG